MRPPTGLVTMLFTDIEGSTRAARQAGDGWPTVLATHHKILGEAIAAGDGYVDGTEGDAFFAVFPTAVGALNAATSAQRALASASWPRTVGELRVRMGLHTAQVDRFNDQYVGLEIHRAARVAAAAHGGQVILTAAARAALPNETPCEDLGAHRLKDFPEPTPLFHVVIDGGTAADHPPPKTLDVLPTNLPPAGVQPIGRDDEIDRVRRACIDGAALPVTVTGLGGSGKTTIALEVARSLLDDHPGGVWLVRAEAFTDRAQLVPAIRDVLWIQERADADPIAEIARRLGERKTMLVLDNLEHLPGVDALVAELVEQCPTTTVLVTSRAPLGLARERAMALEPLPPAAARHLLRRDAGLAPPTEPAGDDADLDELAQRLGGLPLALELVAPRLRMMSARQVLERLGSVSDLSTTASDRPARHRSLRDTLLWTLDLLPHDPRTLLVRLACFHGPAPLDLVEGVCAWDMDVVDALAVLLDHAIVRRDLTGFTMVTAVREVASELLATSAEAELVRRRHAAALAALADPSRRVASSRAEERTERELQEDGWIATQWARTRDPHLHRRLVVGLGPGWALTGQQRRTLDEVCHALDVPDLPAVEQSELLRVRGYVAAHAGRVADAMADGEEALRLAESGADLAEQARALIVLSQAQAVGRSLDASCRSAQAAVERLRSLADEPLLVRGLTELAQTQLALGELAGARAVLDEAASFVDLRHPQLHHKVSPFQADLALAEGDLASALEHYLELIDEGDEYVVWTLAAIVVALSRAGLEGAAAAVEIGAITELAAQDQGTHLQALAQGGEDLASAIARARSMLTPAEAASADLAGRVLPAGQRLARTRELAAQHLASTG